MKILFITGDDYSAMNVDQEIGIVKATKLTEEAGGKLILNDEFYAELSILEFGEVDPKFIDFVSDKLIDYDDSKNTDFFIIKEED